MSPSTAEPQGPVRFVLVDDDAGIRRLVRTAAGLSDLVHYVGDADDGETGLALIRTAGADVAVVDLDLPDIGGDKIAKLVEDEGLECKVIVHSGHQVAELPRGVAEWVVKDGDVEALLMSVQRVVSRDPVSPTVRNRL